MAEPWRLPEQLLQQTPPAEFKVIHHLFPPKSSTSQGGENTLHALLKHISPVLAWPYSHGVFSASLCDDRNGTNFKCNVFRWESAFGHQFTFSVCWKFAS